MTARKRESAAVTAACADLAGIASELNRIRGQMRAIAGRLKVAAKTAEVLGEVEGRPYTVEGWIADYILSDLDEHGDGAMGRVVSEVADLTRSPRADVLAHLAYEREDAENRAARAIGGQS